LIGEACHFIDLLTYLCGALPQRVTASALPDSGATHENNFSLTIEFSDSSVGQLLYAANGDRALPKERLEVFGAGRAAILDDFRRLELFSAGRRRIERSWLRQDKGHKAQWDAFSHAIKAGGSPTIPYDQLIAVTLASFAGLEALRSGQPVDVEQLSFS
jgi:predicted dehydrogenase